MFRRMCRKACISHIFLDCLSHGSSFDSALECFSTIASLGVCWNGNVIFYMWKYTRLNIEIMLKMYSMDEYLMAYTAIFVNHLSWVCYQWILLSSWVCVWACFWSRATSRARDILMTWTPVVCFTSSTALIRWEPLCSTARLINEAQPCAAADTFTRSFKHIHSGQTDCVGGLRAVYTHTKTYTHLTPYSLCAVLL